MSSRVVHLSGMSCSGNLLLDIHSQVLAGLQQRMALLEDQQGSMHNIACLLTLSGKRSPRSILKSLFTVLPCSPVEMPSRWQDQTRPRCCPMHI